MQSGCFRTRPQWWRMRCWRSGGRAARANLYDLFQDAPATLIPRRRRFEITERVAADGGVVTPLAEDEIERLIATLAATRVDAIAISLLFSFLNPEHERRLAARL